MSASFSKMATQTASTKRSTLAVATGLKAAPATYLSGLHILPLYTVGPELRQQLELDTPYVLLQTAVEDVDIIAGDVLVVDGSDYPIKSIQVVPWLGSVRLNVVVEDQKQKV